MNKTVIIPLFTNGTLPNIMLFTTIVDDYGEQDIELFDNNEITKQFRETIAENEQN